MPDDALADDVQISGITALLDRNPMVGEPKAASRRFWTNKEERTLRDTYPAGGVEACVLMLPGRSAIYNHVGKLDLRAPRSRGADIPKDRWKTSPGIDAMIARQYPQCTKRRDVAKLAADVARPRWWVTKRARALNLMAPRFKQPDWSEREIALLYEHGHKSPERVSAIFRGKGLKRSATAINVKMKRLRVSRIDPDHFNANTLSMCFNVDRGTIEAWISRGHLKAGRRGTRRVAQQGGDQWWIHRRDVRQFVIDHTATVDFRKVDKEWLVSLLTDPDLARKPKRSASAEAA